MNIIFKPSILIVFLVISLSFLASQITGLFLPNHFMQTQPVIISTADNKYNIAKNFNIIQKSKNKPVINTKKVKRHSEKLLKEFSLSSIFLDGKNSMVIVRDPKGGVFVYLENKHKGYTLKDVFLNKAKFSKNGDTYWGFLNPNDEKNFRSKIEAQKNNSLSKREQITGTISKNMFEQIKYKNGKYYIPKDIIQEFSNLDRIFSNIAIHPQVVNGKIAFRLIRITKGSVFAEIGLHRGDLITKVNDESFSSIAGPMKYFNDIINMKELKLTIKRGKKFKELKYEVY